MLLNYKEKKFIDERIVDFEYLKEFEAKDLICLGRLSLDMVAFEVKPYRLHSLCLQSILNKNHEEKMKEIEMSKIVGDEEDVSPIKVEEPKPKKEPKVIYKIEKPETSTTEI